MDAMDTHSAKAYVPTVASCSGKLNVAIEAQPLNASVGTEVNVEGNVMPVIPTQPLKLPVDIDTFWGNTNVPDRFTQLEKAYPPIAVREDNVDRSSTPDIPVHPDNAKFPIRVVPDGSMFHLNPEHS